MATPTSISAPVPSSSPPSTSVMEGSVVNLIFSSICHIFRTQKNKFSLYQAYHTELIPSHDPDDPFSIANKCIDANTSAKQHFCISELESPFYPYLNENSMQLGDWYWNQGAQKSKESFRELLGIIGDEGFHPEEVTKTNWQAMDRALGQNQFDNQPDAGDWLDEDDGWRRTTIPVSVPFHSCCQEPGPKTYHIHDFYHRSLTSIIRERISNVSYASQFHYEPYELHWHPPHKEHNMQVYRELYTSDAYIEAHQQLQGLPPKPGCDLSRALAGIMLWSDSTHLTSFGHAKLWPLYLYFRNESNIDIVNLPVSFAAMSRTFKQWVFASFSSCNLIKCSSWSFPITSRILLLSSLEAKHRATHFSCIAIEKPFTNNGRCYLMRSSYMHMSMG